MTTLRTPTTQAGLRQYDHLPAHDAAILAWNTPGKRPGWHRRTQRATKAAMPLLARTIDLRLSADAVRKAWDDPAMTTHQSQVRDAMPVMTRALDRLTEDSRS